MLDVLRAVATIRVVIYHASGDPKWSWFAAMPAMFFVGGALYAKSLDGKPAAQVLRHRLRRILIPMWSWSLLVFVIYSVAGRWSDVPGWGIVGFLFPILPPVGPGGSADALYWTWMALWYLNAYVIFMIVGVPLRRFHQRHPLATLAILGIPVLLSGLLRVDELGALTSNLLFWALGYTYHDRRKQLPSSRTMAVVGIGSGVVAVGYAAAVTGFGVTTTSSPFLNASVGLVWVALAVALTSPINRLAGQRVVGSTVEWIQKRALSIYLWHALATGVVIEMSEQRAGLEHTLPRVALVLGLTFLIVLVVGWVEDLAAGRATHVWPLQPDEIDMTDPRLDLRTPPGVVAEDSDVINFAGGGERG